jgi:hypothetical protein
MGLHRAGVDLASAVERLCDHDLADQERAAGSERLYLALADVRLALTELARRADADTVDPRVVLTVAEGRWWRRGGV